jgi:hypothetical protein
VGLESREFDPNQMYALEKSPKQVSRVFSAMSLGSSKGKVDRKHSFPFSK